MKKLAIKGHNTRGKEVIELLEMLGGKNIQRLNGALSKCCYIIDNKSISVCMFIEDDYVVYTLEEFKDKFPYKIGDKVKTIYGIIGIVKQLVWSNKDNAVRYELEADRDSLYFANELQPYKEETITIDDFKANTKEWLIDKLESMSKDNALQAICDIYDELHKSKYPKTYEECCKVLEIQSDWHLTFELDNIATDNLYVNKEFDYIYKLEAFRKLLICRDAYWKIAGEEMGLDKPWKPDWNDLNRKYFISLNYDGITLYNDFRNPQVLAFPTEEIRDAFYENFKDLIEKCKELL